MWNLKTEKKKKKTEADSEEKPVVAREDGIGGWVK